MNTLDDRRRPVGGRAEERAGRQQEGLHAARSASAKSFWQAPMDKDLYDLATQVNAKVTDANIRAKGTAVMNAFPSVVLHERHVGQYAGSHGITIYGPRPRTRRSTSPTTGPSTSPCTRAGTTSWPPSSRSRRLPSLGRVSDRNVSPDSGQHWADEGAWPVAPGVHRIPLPLPTDGLRAVNVYAIETDRRGSPWSTAAGRSRPVAHAAREVRSRSSGTRPRRHPAVPGHPRAPRPLHAGRRRTPRVRLARQPRARRASRRSTCCTSAGRATADPHVRLLRDAGRRPTSPTAGRASAPTRGPDLSQWGYPDDVARAATRPSRSATAPSTPCTRPGTPRATSSSPTAPPGCCSPATTCCRTITPVDRLRAGAGRPAARRLPRPR